MASQRGRGRRSRFNGNRNFRGPPQNRQNMYMFSNNNYSNPIEDNNKQQQDSTEFFRA